MSNKGGGKLKPRLVVDYPNKVLTTPVSDKAVSEEQAEAHFKEMAKVLKSREDGVALAANQAAIDADMFIYFREDKSLVGVLNPEIIEYSDEMESTPEGCLSLFAWRENVPRHKWVRVRYIEYPTMDEVESKVYDFEARIFQHEIDHLKGRTLLDVPC